MNNTKLFRDIMFVMETTWPIIAVTTIALISLRITYIIKNKKKFIVYEELLKLISIIYILMFFQIVTYQDVISYGNNFIPFKELTRYQIGTSLFYKNIVGNILLFMPYGFFIGYYLRLEKKDSKLALGLILVVSLSIECVQLLIGRCFDVDDILLNLLGGMAGYSIYRILEKVTDKMSKTTISTILTSMIIILIVVLLYMMM
ncbi:MAG: VanZ family protein [Bacilli bacterium]|nr:VanZ family protein [Bacilli bacterium]